MPYLCYLMDVDVLKIQPESKLEVNLHISNERSTAPVVRQMSVMV